MKYAVTSFYNYNVEPIIDYVIISHATDEEINNDGNNWSGRNEGFYLNCYDDLSTAIREAGWWPKTIQFDMELSEEEKDIIVNTVNELILDKKFCSKYNSDIDTVPFTKENIIDSNKIWLNNIVKEITKDGKDPMEGFEPVDTEGYTMEGTVEYKGKEYFVHVSFYQEGTWAESIAESILESIKEEEKENDMER